MGNCIPVSPEVLQNETFVNLMDLLGNFTISEDYPVDYIASEPCHNTYCPFFQRAAPAFLASTCVAAALATGALLVALAKCPHAWPHYRALVAQLAVATGLFAVALPVVAAGIGQGWRLGAGACKATQALWHCSVFVQGLLVASGCCSGVWSRWDPRSQRLAASIWVGALLLAVPAALAGGTVAAPEVSCVRRNVDVLSPAYLLHLASCLCVLLLLPAALLVATLLRGGWRAGWGPGAGASWLFFVLWVPYSVGLAVDFLLHTGLLQHTCGIFERFDYALGLCEALGVLHCCLGPLVLLAAGLCCHKAGAAGASEHPRHPASSSWTPVPSPGVLQHPWVASPPQHLPILTCPHQQSLSMAASSSFGVTTALSAPTATPFGARHPDLHNSHVPGVSPAPREG